MHLPNQEPEILIIKNETKIIITLIRVTKNKMIVCYNSKETKVIITDTTKFCLISICSNITIKT